MDVHVICCNDSLEHAVLNDSRLAAEKLLELKELYFERNKWNFRDRQEYETRCYWHVHTVKGQ